jgi:hypothetical protein
VPTVYPVFLCHYSSYAYVVPRMVTSVVSAPLAVKLIWLQFFNIRIYSHT